MDAIGALVVLSCHESDHKLQRNVSTHLLDSLSDKSKGTIINVYEDGDVIQMFDMQPQLFLIETFFVYFECCLGKCECLQASWNSTQGQSVEMDFLQGVLRCSEAERP